MLTALIDRPDRLVYLSSGMHHDGTAALNDIDWKRRRWNGTQAYCDSKLHVTALRWPPRVLAGHAEQRRRPRLGPNEDGWRVSYR